MTHNNPPALNNEALNIPDTETILRRDEYVIHPWECFDRRHLDSRTVITRGEGIYVYDTEDIRKEGLWSEKP